MPFSETIVKCISGMGVHTRVGEVKVEPLNGTEILDARSSNSHATLDAAPVNVFSPLIHPTRCYWASKDRDVLISKCLNVSRNE